MTLSKSLRLLLRGKLKESERSSLSKGPMWYLACGKRSVEVTPPYSQGEKENCLA